MNTLTVTNNQSEPLTLFGYQKPHVEAIKNILLNKGAIAAWDTSECGHGKTFTSMTLALFFQQNYGWKTMVVAPNEQSLNQTNGWLDLAEKHGVDLVSSITYSKLRGHKSKFNHHNYLFKPDPTKKTSFAATRAFRKLCAGGLFLIFDECHMATRPSSQSHWAAAALIEAVYNHGTMSRALLVTRTPGNKEEHKIPMLRMSGFIRAHKLVQYNPGDGDYQWEDNGLGELMRSAIKFTKKRREVEDCWITLGRGKAKKIANKIFDVVAPYVTVAMQKPDDDKYDLKAMNVFLENTQEGIDLLNQGMELLKGGVAWNDENGEVGDRRKWSLGNISQGLKQIEFGKLGSIARYVKERMSADPKRKFVLAAGAMNTEHQYILQEMLTRPGLDYETFAAIYQAWKQNPHFSKINKDAFRLVCEAAAKVSMVRPVVMNGKTKPADRVKIMDEFQEDNNKINCLIISPAVGNMSISLHDLHGKRPRTMMMTPSYHFDRTVQLTYRVFRAGVQSNAESLLVYSKQGDLEARILQSMVEKSRVARTMIAKDQKATYPGEFPFWVEGKKDEDLEARLTILRARAIAGEPVE